MIINHNLALKDVSTRLDHFWNLSGQKILSIAKEYDRTKGSPVFTAAGKYTSRGWTEWTQGFEYGSAILQFDATGDEQFLEYGRKNTIEKMAAHVGHFGVHDHGFNNVSTYGNLLRLMNEGKIPEDTWQREFYRMALKLSGAIQAKRWTNIQDGGYMYSFNGPHSLFVDTVRTVRALIVSHQMGHAIWDENDKKIDLLDRAVQHLVATAKYSVYYGEGRDSYDEWGRTAHESIFNTNDGNYRCPNAQQGYTGFSTWTRGLAWAITGFAEEIEYLQTAEEAAFIGKHSKNEVLEICLKAVKATCDFFIANTPTDGIPYWDTGAPKLHHLGDYLKRNSDPYNQFEPIDSSAAAIAAQGLLRLGKILEKEEPEAAKKYWQAGLTVVDSLLKAPYLSEEEQHQGLLLHTIYHEPNGWDYKPKGSKVAYGESCMWGDYHLREVVLMLGKMIKGEPYLKFFI